VIQTLLKEIRVKIKGRFLREKVVNEKIAYYLGNFRAFSCKKLCAGLNGLNWS